MQNIIKTVGANIRTKRKELNLTQQQFGDILGCTQQMIQNYEVGYCALPLMMLNTFAKFCTILVNWFLLEEGSMLVYFSTLPE